MQYAIASPSSKATKSKSLQRTGLLLVNGERPPVLFLDLLKLPVDLELLLRREPLPLCLDVGERDGGLGAAGAGGGRCGLGRVGGGSDGAGTRDWPEGNSWTRQAESLHGVGLCLGE